MRGGAPVAAGSATRKEFGGNAVADTLPMDRAPLPRVSLYPMIEGLRSSLSVPRVERVAQAVAQQVEGKNQQEDRDSRPDRHPGRVLDVVLGGVEHASPAGRRWLLPEAQEGQARVGNHRGGDRERGLDDERGHDVGEDV